MNKVVDGIADGLAAYGISREDALTSMRIEAEQVRLAAQTAVRRGSASVKVDRSTADFLARLALEVLGES